MNADRSAIFCATTAEELHDVVSDLFPNSRLGHPRHIGWDENSHQRKPGEWLLDVVWSEDIQPDARMSTVVPANVRCAIECESSTNGDEFFLDFSKLINTHSDMKVFLGGLNQLTPKGAREYMQLRCNQAEQFIQDSRDNKRTTEWLLAFWPSPKKDEQSGTSLWQRLSTARFAHLNRIYLFRLEDDVFVQTP